MVNKVVISRDAKSLPVRKLSLEELKEALSLYNIPFVDTISMLNWPTERHELIHSFQFPKALGYIKEETFWENYHLTINTELYSSWVEPNENLFATTNEYEIQGNKLSVSFERGILHPPEVKIYKTTSHGDIVIGFENLLDKTGRALAFDVLNHDVCPNLLYDFIQDLLKNE